MNSIVGTHKSVSRFGAIPDAIENGGGSDSLQSEISITLHTRAASRLWAGRKKTEESPAIISCPRFADTTRLMEQNVRNDDPYADYHFYEIHNEIISAREKLQKTRKAVEQLIKDNLPEGMSMTKSLSQSPEVIELRIASKLSFLTMYLLADFDILARQVMLARHTALIERPRSEEILYNAQKTFRSVLHRSTKWRFTGVTRDDMAANNQKAQRAIELMGQLDEEFLKGEKRSSLAPPIMKKSGLDDMSVVPEGIEAKSTTTEEAVDQ